MMITTPTLPVKRDILNTLLSNYLKKNWGQSLIIVLSVAGILLDRNHTPLYVVLISSLIIFHAVNCILLWLKISSPKFMPNASERYFEITDQEIKIIYGDNTQVSILTQNIATATRVGNYYVLTAYNNGVIFIPENCIDPKDLNWFENDFINQINRNRKPQKTFEKVPPSIYLFCLLFFIPIIGAIAGFVLIFRGINYYKSRLLVIMGIIGVSMTIIFYGVMFYKAKYDQGGFFDKSLIDMTQMFLSADVREIELYKVTNGHYPDSLELIVGGSFVNINDPILKKIGKKGDSTKFYYQRTESGYYLFSAGFDGKPFTSDDLHPLITDQERSHFGLERKVK